MQTIVGFLIAVVLSLNFCEAQKTTVRPYKFGFEIAEQQHRSEQRDEAGIIMGEFGFITADGIYHVTVYATDEQGRFKILSMKNYPYSKRQQAMETIVTTVRPRSTTTAQAPKRVVYGARACSGCSLRNPKKEEEEEPTIGNIPKTEPVTKDDNMYGIDLRYGKNDYELGTEFLVKPNTLHETHTHTTLTPHAKKVPQDVDSSLSKGFNENNFELGSEHADIAGRVQDIFGSIDEPVGAASTLHNNIAANTNTQTHYHITQMPNDKPKMKVRGPGVKTSQGTTRRPTATVTQPLPTKDMRQTPQNIGKTVPSNDKVAANQGEFDVKEVSFAKGRQTKGKNAVNAPNVNNGDDLYRFKYLLDYNGHRETGKQSGNKVGDFYSIDNDNVKHSIEYIANEFGYQPHLKLEKVGTVKPTKDNTLKEYEFVWFKKGRS